MKFKQYKPCWWNCSLGIMALASPGVLLEKKNLGPIWDPQNQNLHFKQILRGFLYMLHLRRSALHPWAHLMDRKEAFFFWTFFKKSHVMTMKETEISVWFSYSVVFDSLWPHESQHARPPCPSPTPGVHPNSCPLSRWCHPAISSSVVWDECNCVVVWALFGIAFLWDWNENCPFPVLWPLLSFPNFLTYWVQHFHSIIFQDLK